KNVSAEPTPSRPPSGNGAPPAWPRKYGKTPGPSRINDGQMGRGRRGLQRSGNKIVEQRPHFLLGRIDHTASGLEAAIIRARFEGAGLTVDPSRPRMQRGEPFRQLRTENRKGRHPAERGQVPRPGVIANEEGSLIDQREQFRDGRRRGEVLLSSPQPPRPLIRIASDLDPPTRLAQPPNQAALTVQRPY